MSRLPIADCRRPISDRSHAGMANTRGPCTTFDLGNRQSAIGNRLIPCTLLLFSLLISDSISAQSADSGRVVVLSHPSTVFGNTRSIRVYLPPGYDSEGQSYPVFYFNDGFAVFSPRHWNVPGTVDSLIRARTIPSLIVVGIDNAASIPGNPVNARTSEYLPWPDATEPEVPSPRGAEYPALVVDEVMPFIARQFRVLAGPENTGIGGSSYGGIAALNCVLRRPGTFGMLLLESTPLFLFNRRLLEETRSSTVLPSSVYVGVGTQETDDAAVLRAAAGVQEAFVGIVRNRTAGARVLLNVVESATHSSAAWRARMPAALTFLLQNLRLRSPSGG